MPQHSVWIALSAKGFPAYFIGYWRTRTELQLNYKRVFGHDVAAAGYRVVKAALLVPPAPSGSAPQHDA